MGNLEETPEKRKVVSLLYIAIGKTGRKMLMDKFPKINILLIQLQNIVQHCTESFQVPRKRTLGRQTFLSQKQKPNETLHQFSNVLNGLAARCDFGNQTEGLVYDIFVLNMTNRQVQEKLCTEPKENLAEALQFALAFKDGLKRQRTYGNIKQGAEVQGGTSVFGKWYKTEQSRMLEMRCRCKAPNSICNYCGKKGHLEKVCNQKKSDNNQKFGKIRGLANKFNLSTKKSGTKKKKNTWS